MLMVMNFSRIGPNKSKAGFNSSSGSSVRTIVEIVAILKSFGHIFTPEIIEIFIFVVIPFFDFTLSI